MKPTTTDRQTKVRVATAVLAALVLHACASAPIRKSALASEQLALSVERLQTTVLTLHDQRVLSDEAYRSWQKTFATMAKSGLALNQALRDANGKDAATQVRALVDAVDTLLQEDVIHIPAEHRTLVILALESLRSVLLALSVSVEG